VLSIAGVVGGLGDLGGVVVAGHQCHDDHAIPLPFRHTLFIARPLKPYIIFSVTATLSHIPLLPGGIKRAYTVVHLVLGNMIGQDAAGMIKHVLRERLHGLLCGHGIHTK